MIEAGYYDKSTLNYGVFAFSSYISDGARKKLDIRVSTIIESFDKIVKSHKNLQSFFKGGNINKSIDNSQWLFVGCYIIEPLR